MDKNEHVKIRYHQTQAQISVIKQEIKRLESSLTNYEYLLNKLKSKMNDE